MPVYPVWCLMMSLSFWRYFPLGCTQPNRGCCKGKDLATSSSRFCAVKSGHETQVGRTLLRIYALMRLRPICIDINPKAVTSDELFGFFNPTTGDVEMTETFVVYCSRASRTKRQKQDAGPKWIVIDDDIDPGGIESGRLSENQRELCEPYFVFACVLAFGLALAGDANCNQRAKFWGGSSLVEEVPGCLSEEYITRAVPMHYFMTSEMLQGVLENSLEKKAGRSYGLPGSKHII